MSRKKEDFCNGVIFLDKTTIELFPNRQLHLRVPQNAKNCQKNKAQHAQFSDKTLMFCGFIKKSG